MAHDILFSKSGNVLISSIAGGLGWGAILGGLQKSFFMRYLNFRGKNWTFATIIGLMLYIAFQVSHQYLLILIASPIEYPLYSITYSLLELAFYFIPPLILGIAQWSILRLYFTRSRWWIATITIGVGCAGMAVSEVAKLAIANGFNNITIFSIAVNLMEGFAYGITTWFVLAFFARQLAIANSSDSQ
jgi:hypothetical protein